MEKDLISVLQVSLSIDPCNPRIGRLRAVRGDYGPVTYLPGKAPGGKVSYVSKTELQKRGYKLPPPQKDNTATDLAGRALLRMLDLVLSHKIFDPVQKAAIVTSFAAVDTEYQLGLGALFIDEIHKGASSPTKPDNLTPSVTADVAPQSGRTERVPDLEHGTATKTTT